MTEVDFTGRDLRVVGPTTPGVSGGPFNSALLINTYQTTMTADLTAAGSGYTPVSGHGWEGLDNLIYGISDIVFEDGFD